MLEEEKLFSKQRAMRGGKIGAKVGAGLVLGSLTIAAPIIGIALPNQFADAVNYIYEKPTETLKGVALGTGFHAAYWGLIGATVDSFRPTSKLITRQINQNIEAFKGVKNGIVNGYRFLRSVDINSTLDTLKNADYSQPFLPEYRPFMGKSAVIGAIGGISAYGLMKMSELSDRLLSGVTGHEPNQILSAIAGHPVEFVLGGTALGLGIAAYLTIFDRPQDSELNY